MKISKKIIRQIILGILVDETKSTEIKNIQAVKVNFQAMEIIEALEDLKVFNENVTK